MKTFGVDLERYGIAKRPQAPERSARFARCARSLVALALPSENGFERSLIPFEFDFLMRLGTSWANLSASWAHLGASWAHLGASWAPYWIVWGASWARLGRIVARLGTALNA